MEPAPPHRPCSKCGGDGPFYASQPVSSWCAPCHRAASKARYAAQKQARIAQYAALRQSYLARVPPEARTRREHLALLRQACPPTQ